MKTIIAITAAALTVSACAQQPDQIQAAYVDPAAYTGLSCGKLISQRNEVVYKVNRLTGQQQQAANNDAGATAIALIVFWPAALAIGAGGDYSQELAFAKGEYEAISRVMQAKGCKA